MLVHTDVVRLIETTEHAYLRELGDTREQDKLQISIGSLEDTIETFQDLTIPIFQQPFFTLY